MSIAFRRGWATVSYSVYVYSSDGEMKAYLGGKLIAVAKSIPELVEEVRKWFIAHDIHGEVKIVDRTTLTKIAEIRV